MEKIKLSKYAVDLVTTICDKYNNEESELINILHNVQEEAGYLPKELQHLIAKLLSIPVAKVFGVVSFYSFFTMTPKGEFPVSICMGTACYVRGADKLVDEFKSVLKIDIGGTTDDKLFSLDCLRCVGACGLAPVVMVGDKVYGRVEVDEVAKIVEEYKAKVIDKAGRKQLLPTD